MSLGTILFLGASVTAGTFGISPAALYQQRTGEPYELQARAMRRLADQPMERVRAAGRVVALDAAFWDAAQSDCAPGIAALQALFEARREYAFNEAAQEREPTDHRSVNADLHKPATTPAAASPTLILATVPAIWRDDFQPCRSRLNAYMEQHCTDACRLIRLEGTLAPPGLHPNAAYLERVLDAVEKEGR